MKTKEYSLTFTGRLFLEKVRREFPEYADSLKFWWDK